ncbi:VOC family protein [Actinophytocola sp.]|uniref:VOC family protein n=1 Tax=Actinophytocola sp. TaxID=1872138 RepID=UPI003D6A9A27
MPGFSKVSHISFSARDAAASASWYRRVLGFEPLDEFRGAHWVSVLVIHPATRLIVELQQHDANAGEEFDPRRTGFDHLSLVVDSRAELDEWLAHFARLGVRHSPIADLDGRSLLSFRDPDGIQLELYHRPDHP